MKTDEEIFNMKVLRSLSPAELVYDFEHSQNCHIFSNAMLVSAQLDLFSHRDVIYNALVNWCKLNPFLRTKIIPEVNSSNQQAASSFSIERNFMLVSVKNLDLMKNVEIYDSNNEKEYNWRMFYEREFNRHAPVSYNSHNLSDLLWRLCFVKLGNNNGCFRLCVIMTMHHAITDARNAFQLLTQFIQLVEKSMKRTQESLEWLDEISPSLESYIPLIGDHQIKSDLFEIEDNSCKIPSSFQINESSNNLQTDLVTRFNSFIIDKVVFKKVINSNTFFLKYINHQIFHFFIKILEKCKSKNLKLTGCLNLICLIATNEAYKKFDANHETYYYHLMVSLRPDLNLSNSQMGFFASHLDCECKRQSVLNVSNDEFWKKAKIDSDNLHVRLENKEHINILNKDVELINEIETASFPNGGGVHFALSNLGNLKPPVELDLFRIDEFYYQVSMEEHRWSSLIFNGISTLDEQLIWGITYNSRLIRTEIIEFMSETIQHLFNTLAI